MIIPQSVVVGPYVLEIDTSQAGYDDMVRDMGEHPLGACDVDQDLIVLNPCQGEWSRRVTLLHEVLHAVWHVAIRDDEALGLVEEITIGRLAPTLVATLRANPELVAYVVSEP